MVLDILYEQIDNAWWIFALIATAAYLLYLFYYTIFNVYPRIYDNDPCNIYYRAKHNYDKLKEMGEEDQAISINIYKEKWGKSIDEITSDDINIEMCTLTKKEQNEVFKGLNIETNLIGPTKRYSIRNMGSAGLRSIEGTIYNLVRVLIPYGAALIASVFIFNFDDTGLNKRVLPFAVMAITYIYSTTTISLHDRFIGTKIFKGLYIDVVFVITAFLFILKISKYNPNLDRIDRLAAGALTSPGTFDVARGY